MDWYSWMLTLIQWLYVWVSFLLRSLSECIICTALIAVFDWICALQVFIIIIIIIVIIIILFHYYHRRRVPRWICNVHNDHSACCTHKSETDTDKRRNKLLIQTNCKLKTLDLSRPAFEPILYIQMLSLDCNAIKSPFILNLFQPAQLIVRAAPSTDTANRPRC